MKNSIIAVLTLSTCILTIGCATTSTTTTSANETYDAKGVRTIAASEQPMPNLPAVAAPPTSSWGGNSLLR